MKITFLGTGTSQGIPVIGCQCKVCLSADRRDKRLRTSAMVEIDGRTIVIDAGPDFRQQMLREDVRRIDAIIVTHEHKDHIGGLDDVRAFNYVMKCPAEVYGDVRVHRAIMRDFPYAFGENKYPGAPEINMHLIDNGLFSVSGIDILPIEIIHLSLPIKAFRIQNFTYITDASYIAPNEINKIRGTEVLVVNALRHDKHVSHFSLTQALELINEISPREAYLIHMSHQMGLHADVERQLPPNVRLAYDGLKVEC